MSKKRTSQKIIALAMAAAMCAGTGAMATTTGSFLIPSLVVSAADEEATPLSDFTAYSSFPKRLQSYNGSAESIVIPAKNSKGDYFTAIGYNSNNQFLTDSVNEVTSVSFEKGNHITIISSGAFKNYTKLETIVLPEGLTKIDTYAFQGCTGLKEIVIPSTVTSIGSRAFMGCTNLQKITFKSRSNADLTLGQSAFENCTALETVNFEDNSVNTVGFAAFRNCAGLKLVKLGKGVTGLGSESFVDCANLKAIVIPSSCTSFESNHTPAFTKGSDLMIYGEAGSAALSYAAKNKFKYAEIPQDQSEISASNIPVGGVVTVTPNVSGGYSSVTDGTRIKNFKYKIEFAKSSGEVIKQTDWIRQGDQPNYNLTIPAKDNYKITVAMQDENGVDAVGTFDVKGVEVSEPLSADAVISSEQITLGKSVTVNVDANGGSVANGGYTYSIQYAEAAANFGKDVYSETSSAEFTPSETGDYLVKINVKDSAGTVVERYLSFTVTEKLRNFSSVSIKGNKVIVDAKAAGGNGDYTYGIYYKKDTATSKNWTTKKSEKVNTDPHAVLDFSANPGIYNVCVKVKDSSTGTIAKKYFNVVFNLDLDVSFSAESIKLGETLKVTANANGGTGEYTYAVYYKQKAQSKWTTKQDFCITNTVSLKPAKAVEYDVCIKVKDGNGTIIRKYFTVNVE